MTRERRRPVRTVGILGGSTSLCPECFRRIDCRYEARGDEVWQAKRCPDHGAFESVVWHGVDHWQWTQETTVTDSDGTCDVAGSDDRNRCLAVVDVTMDCDLECNWCFASSRPGLDAVPMHKVRALLETVLDRSGGPTPIQLSGGEPTTRDDLPEIVAMAAEMGFRNIEVNTNGLRLAREPAFVERLQKAGASAVYMQFDGFGASVYKEIRNTKDLTPTKLQAIENCRRVGLPVILVPTIVAGANDDQLGQIVRFALENLDVVRGINIQPVSHFGRSREETPHLSVAAIAERLERQTGFLRARDLRPVPCCGPQCTSATMLLRLPWRPGAPVPLTRFMSDAAFRDIMDAFDKTRLMDALAGDVTALEAGRDAALCCGIPVPPGVDRLAPHLLALSVTGFMDADNIDVARLDKCCINVPTAEGQLVPFCGYNLTDRKGRYRLREQYRALATGPLRVIQ